MIRKLTLISLPLALLLTGCGGQELTNVTLIQTLGVDGVGPVELTAVGDEEDDPTVYHAAGKDVTQAQEGLNRLGETRLEVTHVAQLVLGRSADLEETLWQELSHRKSGYGATVWLCDPSASAGELLDGAKNPSKRLESLEKNAGVQAPTILEALSALTREGRVELPVLALEGEELRVVGREMVKEG